MSTSYDPQHDVPRDKRDKRDTRDRPDDPDLRDDPDRGDATDPRSHSDRRDEADLRDGSDARDLRDPAAAPRQAEPHERPVATAPPATAADLGLDRRAVVARERAEYGGIKIGSAFFGWLTATGTAVLLTGLLAGIGVAVGIGTGTDAGEAADLATRNPGSVSLAGAISLIVILFVSYYCGGYVAGRMARFNGAKQGIAVWLWALAVAVVVAIVAATAGDKYDVLARLNGFPRLPVNEGDLPTAGIVTALALAAAALVGAVLGGLAGMRFHRRVDRVGLEPAAAATVE